MKSAKQMAIEALSLMPETASFEEMSVEIEILAAITKGEKAADEAGGHLA